MCSTYRTVGSKESFQLLVKLFKTVRVLLTKLSSQSLEFGQVISHGVGEVHEQVEINWVVVGWPNSQNKTTRVT